MKQESKATDGFDYTPFIGGFFLIIGLIFAYRSFYSMRIKNDPE